MPPEPYVPWPYGTVIVMVNAASVWRVMVLCDRGPLALDLRTLWNDTTISAEEQFRWRIGRDEWWRIADEPEA